MTYPSGRSVTYTLDAADQITGVQGSLGGTTTPYASGITYTGAGDLASVPFYNGMTEQNSWNSRLEPTAISVGNLLGLNYTYCDNQQVLCASGNTGSPWQQTIAVGGQTMGDSGTAYSIAALARPFHRP